MHFPLKVDKANASDGDMLRECLNSLTRGWTVVARDRSPITSPQSKKIAIFGISNILLKLYFKLNTLPLCGKLITTVEGKDGESEIMTQLRHFPVSDVVSYKYYIGRLKMYEDKYEEAR